MYPIEATRSLAMSILMSPNDRDWTLQGFGMLRTYLPGDVRLHVWDSRYRVENVSLIHDHPWDFESLIVAGQITNTRYQICGPAYGQKFMCREIRPGEGLVPLTTDRPCVLSANPPEILAVGNRYRQRANEIHASEHVDGTVTIVQRRRVGEDKARVFFHEQLGFVSAEPRKATVDEVYTICKQALEMHF